MSNARDPDAVRSVDDVIGELRAPFALKNDAHVHLNAAGVAPMTQRAVDAGQRLLTMMQRGSAGLAPIFAELDSARATFASLVNCAPADLGFFQTCAAAITQAAFGITLRADDEIVLLDQEYPSNAYPWIHAAARAGARVVTVPSGPDLKIDPRAMFAAINTRTRVVAVSWVQFSSGASVDLRELAQRTHAVGALLVTDAIQGIGAVPFDLHALGVDIACGGTHKWLLGPLGHGFMACAPGITQKLTPVLHGAMTYGTPDDPVDPKRPPRPDAKRFEPGNPPLLGAITAAASVRALLDIGIARVMHEGQLLKTLLVQGLASRGYAIKASAGPVTSTITTFAPRTEPVNLVARLREHNVTVVPRGGGVRVAPHIHNTAEHIEAFFAVLDVLDR